MNEPNYMLFALIGIFISVWLQMSDHQQDKTIINKIANVNSCSELSQMEKNHKKQINFFSNHTLVSNTFYEKFSELKC
jgi:hypothetical protein